MNPIKAIDKMYVQTGLNEPGRKPVPNVLRMSSIGYQPRRTVLHRRTEEFPPREADGRGFRTFEVGHQRHDALRTKLVAAGIRGSVPVTKEMEFELVIPLPGTDWIIRGHPDGVMDEIEVKGVAYRNVLLEIKTAGAAGWRNIVAGMVEDGYLDQAMIYADALKAEWIYFLFERKDTQALCELVVPFDKGRAEAAKQRALAAIQYLAKGTPALEVPACEGDDYGYKMRGGGRGKTSLLSLGWKCSYCQFVQHCFPTHVRMLVSGKQVCVEELAVPDDAVVIGMGVDVIPRGSWKVLKEENEDA